MLVYLITNLVNGKKYVGKTIGTVGRRWSEHKYGAKRGRNNHYLYRAIRKYGPESFSIQPIGRFYDEPTLAVAEQLFIAEFGTSAPNGYNLTNGGEGSTGYKHSEDAVLKMKAAWSPQRKAACRERHRRENWTPEHRAAVSVAITQSNRRRAGETRLKGNSCHLTPQSLVLMLERV